MADLCERCKKSTPACTRDGLVMICRAFCSLEKCHLSPCGVDAGLGKCRRSFADSSNGKVSAVSTSKDVMSNPYLSKYADKIANLKKTSAVQAQETKHADSVVVRGNHGPTTKLNCEPRQDPSLNPVLVELNNVMKVDLLQDLSSDEILKIWIEYHKTQNKIAAVIPASIYSTIYQRSLQFPTFVYPLPRLQGYEFIVAQFSSHQCHFTSLLNYQTFKENAPVCLTIMHYTDIQQSKGIILMRGEYDKTIINGSEASCLANQVQLYYAASPDDSKFKLLEIFNLHPDNFKYEDLINEIQTFSLMED